MARYHIVSMSFFTVQQVQLTVDFTIEPRPSGAVIPGAFTHSFFNGAVLNQGRFREHRRTIQDVETSLDTARLEARHIFRSLTQTTNPSILTPALGAHPVRGKGSAHPPKFTKVANLLSA